MIYGFAFGKTNAASILYRTRNVDHCYLVFGETSINGYINLLLHDQPSYILGLGSYPGIDQDKIRIEMTCTNQFRNGYMEGTVSQTIDIHPFPIPESFSKYADGIGNSYCNMVSWKIMKLINDGSLQSKYSFLPIPKSMYCNQAAEQIDKLIRQFSAKY